MVSKSTTQSFRIRDARAYGLALCCGVREEMLLIGATVQVATAAVARVDAPRHELGRARARSCAQRTASRLEQREKEVHDKPPKGGTDASSADRRCPLRALSTRSATFLASLFGRYRSATCPSNV